MEQMTYRTVWLSLDAPRAAAELYWQSGRVMYRNVLVSLGALYCGRAVFGQRACGVPRCTGVTRRPQGRGLSRIFAARRTAGRRRGAGHVVTRVPPPPPPAPPSRPPPPPAPPAMAASASDAAASQGAPPPSPGSGTLSGRAGDGSCPTAWHSKRRGCAGCGRRRLAWSCRGRRHGGVVAMDSA